VKSMTECSQCHQDAPFPDGAFWTHPQDSQEWYWSHATCAPRADVYVLDGPQIDTPDKASQWRRQLLDLPWLRLGALDRGLQSLHPSLCGGCC
jgi:hypothetical protein